MAIFKKNKNPLTPEELEEQEERNEEFKYKIELASNMYLGGISHLATEEDIQKISNLDTIEALKEARKEEKKMWDIILRSFDLNGNNLNDLELLKSKAEPKYEDSVEDIARKLEIQRRIRELTMQRENVSNTNTAVIVDDNNKTEKETNIIGKEDFKEVAESSISEKSSVFNTLKFAKEEMEAEKDTEEK